jgi:hypothetical protein
MLHLRRTFRRFCGSPKGIRIPVSALRGRRPRPLDDGAAMVQDLPTFGWPLQSVATVGPLQSAATEHNAAREGFEPSHAGSEPAVLPLDDLASRLGTQWIILCPCEGCQSAGRGASA